MRDGAGQERCSRPRWRRRFCGLRRRLDLQRSFFIRSAVQAVCNTLRAMPSKSRYRSTTSSFFLLLFRTFQIEPDHQPKVLFWGVLGAIVMRGAFISAGVGLLQHFHWISYLFGGILLFAAVRLVLPEGEKKKGKPVWIQWIAKAASGKPAAGQLLRARERPEDDDDALPCIACD